jgi:formylglycine-generating enzyme required for sulfatase activity
MARAGVYNGDGFENHPMVCVDWCDAYAYCQAVGKRLCGRIGGGPVEFNAAVDPTQSQWHHACVSGTANYTRTYGDAYEPLSCNGEDYPAASGSTTEVGSLEMCQSAVPDYEGVFDLNGNVYEWEDSCYSGGCRTRGGAYGSSGAYFSCDVFAYLRRDYVLEMTGFRCCSP